MITRFLKILFQLTRSWKSISRICIQNAKSNSFINSFLEIKTYLWDFFRYSKCFSTSTPLNIKLPFPDIVQSSVGNSKGISYSHK